jgi:hypothetical protein
MGQNHNVGYVENMKSLLTTSYQAALNYQRQGTSNDTIKQQPACIGRSAGNNTTDKWYVHQPNTVTEKDEITILWDMPVQTNKRLKLTSRTLSSGTRQQRIASSLTWSYHQNATPLSK